MFFQLSPSIRPPAPISRVVTFTFFRISCYHCEFHMIPPVSSRMSPLRRAVQMVSILTVSGSSISFVLFTCSNQNNCCLSNSPSIIHFIADFLTPDSVQSRPSTVLCEDVYFGGHTKLLKDTML